jgi:hypothetical protein
MVIAPGLCHYFRPIPRGWASPSNRSLFLRFGFPRWNRRKPNFKKSEKWLGVAFTQDGGLGGLVLGYYLAAP